MESQEKRTRGYRDTTAVEIAKVRAPWVYGGLEKKIAPHNPPPNTTVCKAGRAQMGTNPESRRENIGWPSAHPLILQSMEDCTMFTLTLLHRGL